MWFSRQECWSGLPLSSPVDHILSEISMTCPSWVALHGMAQFHWVRQRLWSMWSIWLVLCDCGFHSVCLLMRIRGLWKLPDGRDWLWGKLGFSLVGRAMLSKSLIQFSVDGCSCVPSLLFTWVQTMVALSLVAQTKTSLVAQMVKCLLYQHSLAPGK